MRKIVDSHTHIGIYESWNCRIEALKNLMDSHGIIYAVTADLSGNALGARSTPAAIFEARKFEDAYKVLIWVNPACEGDPEVAEDLIIKHPSMIAGIKTHPKTSGIRLDDDRYRPYMEVCRKYGLPFVSHTENDGFSNTGYLPKWAEAYPAVDFVAVHMDLFTDHKDAVHLISTIPNLFGDTSLVSAQDTLTAVEACGAVKILFGSDAPVMGASSYDVLEELERILPGRFGQKAADQIFFRNTEKIFHLDLFV